MQSAGREIDGNDAAAGAVLHDEFDGEVLDVELGIVLERLLIQGVQHRVAGAVCCCAGTLRSSFPEIRRHATERPLINSAIFGT